MATEVDRLELVLEANLARVNQQLTALETRLYGIKGAMRGTAVAGNVPLISNAAIAGATRNSKSLLASLSKITFAFFALRRVGRFVMDSIKSSMDFAETTNLFQTVFRKLGMDAGEEFELAFLDRAQEFNEKLSSAFTLDPKVLMDYQSRFAQMANSMGLVSETAYEISEGFTALGLDIASLFNINISDAMLKLQSGLAGQIRPLRTLGVDISKTSLAAAALSYGITESFEKMDAATKVQLRYLEVMRQLEIVYGDMARTIQSPANQARILAANFDLLKRSIGNSLIPMITWLMPYLNGIAIALTSIAQQIAVFFGWEMPDWKITPIYSSEDIDYADEMGDSIDGVTDSVKKYKNSILGIDQLNLMAKQDTGSGSGSAGGGSGGYAVLDKAIADRTKKYMDELNKQVEQMTNKGKEFAEQIEGKMKKVLAVVGVIGATILAWKFATGFATGLNALITLFGGGAEATGIGGVGATALTASAGFSALSLSLFSLAAGATLLYENTKTVKGFVEQLDKLNDGKTSKTFGDMWKTVFKSFTSDFKDAKDKSDYYAAEQASNVIKAAVKTRDETIFAANAQYEGVVAEYAKLYGVGTPEYEAMVKTAQDARDGTINAANEQFSSVRDSAIKNLGAASVWVDAETGKMLGSINDFGKSWKAAFEEMFNVKIPNAFKKIIQWLADLGGKAITVDAKSTVSGTSQGEQLATKYMFGSTLPKLDFSYDGGIFKSGDIFSSRENGMPELVGRYGNQTGVMNNDQIVQSVSQGVASAVKSVLGGGMGGGDIHIKIVNADGTVTGEQIITAAQRYNQRFGETIIQAG